MNQQQATTMMKQPPNVISTKDCMYLEDMLSWNLAISKQASHYMNEVTDMDVKNQLQAVATMHKKHYQQLLQMFQNNNNQ